MKLLRRWRRSWRVLSDRWLQQQARQSMRVEYEGPAWHWPTFLADQKAREARQANDWIRVEVRGEREGF